MIRVEHLVIGAGFAGLAIAIRFDQAGHGDYLVLDKGSDVGGTWRDNTYPGAACDVPSQLYSLSFAPNPNWSMSFSPQPEIQAYLQRVAQQHQILDRFRFEHTVTHAAWDEREQAWQVTASSPAGESHYLATTLINGAGGLSEPRLPDIDGIDSFAGEVFHSARWNHDVDLTDKRVAIIGTGASAIQIVPEVQRRAAHLDLYQRTAPYVLPRNDRRYTGVERWGFGHLPGLQRLYRSGIYWARETYVPGFTLEPKLAWPAKRLALANLARGVSDPDLRRRLTPHFEIGCKRILLSNTYYPAIASDNVELVTDSIQQVTPTGIVDAQGCEREVDVIIVATGFHTTEQPIAERIIGRDGRSLAEVWATGGQNAYKGTTVAGFPNLFCVVGPNTGLGHSSMVFIIESQVAYIVDAVTTMRTHRYAAIEPRPDAQRAWNDDLQRRMKRTVWNTGGCSSWYLDAHGRNTTLWPRTTFTFRSLLGRFDIDAYRVEAAHLATEEITA